MKATFRKTQFGLMPADEESEEWFYKQKPGALVTGEWRKKQNPKFHAKLFALLKCGFENWEPGEIQVSINNSPVSPQKNFEQFRRDLTILAGYYYVTVRLDGSTRIQAMSLSFDKMSAEEREDVYSKYIDILLARVYQGEDREAVDKIVQDYLNYA